MKKQTILTIKNKSEILYLNLDSILYIQADGNYSDIYFADGSVINTLTYQRAEIARMMDEQLSKEEIKRFALLGRSYLINTDYVLRIQPNRQLLTFRVNKFGTTRKIRIKATAKALQELENCMDELLVKCVSYP
jgi:DNA-binding LytR/AlgR family response regulator